MVVGLESRLTEVDELLRKHVAKPQSLCPEKAEITTFSELGRTLFRKDHSKILLSEAVSGLKAVVASQVRNFPDNIFWDYDYFCAVIFKKTSSKDLLEFIRAVEHLMDIYGVHSEICFQFAHDFTYGFDWARWVAKMPVRRKNIHLFHIDFLEYLTQRNGEIRELIEKGDEKYHKLKRGTIRNPFSFSRKTEDESYILKTLAWQNLIPVPSWELEPKSDWSRDYTRIREDLLSKLQDFSL